MRKLFGRAALLQISRSGLVVLILLSVSTHCNCAMKFKYFALENFVQPVEIVHSDDRAINTVIVRLKKTTNFLHILCVPFTHNEYQQSIRAKVNRETSLAKRKSLAVEVAGRMLEVRTRVLDAKRCHFTCERFFDGIGMSILYSGGCITPKQLTDILSSIRFNVSREEVDTAREEFLQIMKAIRELNVPIYPKAFNVERQYSFVGLSRKIQWLVNTSSSSKEISEFYSKYFSGINWKAHRMSKDADLDQKKLFCSWIDQSEQIIARLVISNATGEADKPEKQMIYIDFVPFIPQEW